MEWHEKYVEMLRMCVADGDDPKIRILKVWNPGGEIEWIDYELSDIASGELIRVREEELGRSKEKRGG